MNSGAAVNLAFQSFIGSRLPGLLQFQAGQAAADNYKGVLTVVAYFDE